MHEAAQLDTERQCLARHIEKSLLISLDFSVPVPVAIRLAVRWTAGSGHCTKVWPPWTVSWRVGMDVQAALAQHDLRHDNTPVRMLPLQERVVGFAGEGAIRLWDGTVVPLGNAQDTVTAFTRVFRNPQVIGARCWGATRFGWRKPPPGAASTSKVTLSRRWRSTTICRQCTFRCRTGCASLRRQCGNGGPHQPQTRMDSH